MNDQPLAYFITWTVYGTFLQGDERGWRRWKGGHQPPQPRLAEWRRERLLHKVVLLNADHRRRVIEEIERLSSYRGWKLWARDARTNHVHVVVSASEMKGSKVRDQLKANCTRVLREDWPVFVDRPVWTVGGDWECVNDEDELEHVMIYVAEAQDRKGTDADRTGR